MDLSMLRGVYEAVNKPQQALQIRSNVHNHAKNRYASPLSSELASVLGPAVMQLVYRDGSERLEIGGPCEATCRQNSRSLQQLPLMPGILASHGSWLGRSCLCLDVP